MRYSQYKFNFYLNASHAIYIDGKMGESHPHTWEIVLYTIKKQDNFVMFNEVEKTVENYLNKYQNKFINDFSSTSISFISFCFCLIKSIYKMLFFCLYFFYKTTFITKFVCPLLFMRHLRARPLERVP